MTAQHPLIQHLLKEQEALLQKIPEWKADPKKAQAEMAKLRAGLVEHYGVEPALVETFPHHHGVLIARDALKARELQAHNERLKAQLAAHKKAEAAGVQDRQTDEDFKRRLADTRRSHGGKAPIHEQIAEWVETKEKGGR